MIVLGFQYFVQIPQRLRVNMARKPSNTTPSLENVKNVDVTMGKPFVESVKLVRQTDMQTYIQTDRQRERDMQTCR